VVSYNLSPLIGQFINWNLDLPVFRIVLLKLRTVWIRDLHLLEIWYSKEHVLRMVIFLDNILLSCPRCLDGVKLLVVNDVNSVTQIPVVLLLYLVARLLR
jgi:hypothetical protein